MAPWHLVQLPLLCFAAAILELDAVHVGQSMISRPLVLGPLFGLACGNILVGIQLGVWMELLIIRELPVGNVLPLNGALAAAAAVLMSGGANHVEPAAAFPAGLLLGSVHRRIENRARQGRAQLTRMAERALERKRTVPFLRIFTYSLAGHALLTAGFLYVTIAVLSPLLVSSWTAAPEAVRRGFRWAFEAVPWLGAAGLMRAFWK